MVTGFRPLVAGILAAIIVIVLLSVVLAIVMLFVKVQSRVEGFVLDGMNLVSALCGGYVAGVKARRRGLVNGAIVGLIYSLILIFLGSGGLVPIAVNSGILRRIVLASIGGALGGVLGING